MCMFQASAAKEAKKRRRKSKKQKNVGNDVTSHPSAPSTDEIRRSTSLEEQVQDDKNYKKQVDTENK